MSLSKKGETKMRSLAILCVSLFLFSGVAVGEEGVATVDVRSDAEAIAALEVTTETMQMGVDMVADVVAQNIALEFKSSGIDVSDEATAQIVSQFKGPLLRLMEEGARKETARVYERTLSPETLAAYRAFIESPEGAEYRAKLPNIMSQLLEYGQLSGAAHGAAAFKELAQDVQNENWVGNPSDSVKNELRKLYAPSEVQDDDDTSL